MTTALFLGRFQPPHVGHLLTIRGLAQRFERVIVGVTECEPSVMTVEHVCSILRRLLPEPAVTVVAVPGSVEGGTAVIDVAFDVCCSGNPAVLAIMQGRGHRTEFVERSLDAFYSGTQERQSFVDGALRTAANPDRSHMVEYAVVKTSSLRPIERIHPRHYRGLERQLLESGVMLRPVIVDKVTRAVLDGSHRYAFLVEHGYEAAPVLLCDYDDESVFVGNRLGHRWEFDPSKWISKRHVRATAISGSLYAPRTTRHFFPFRKTDVPTRLDSLQRGPPKPIDHLLAAVSPEQEVLRNREYIEEIERELQVLRSYTEEQSSVAGWLRRQNEYIEAGG